VLAIIFLALFLILIAGIWMLWRVPRTENHTAIFFLGVGGVVAVIFGGGGLLFGWWLMSASR
jgi:hypothetical protein